VTPRTQTAPVSTDRPARAGGGGVSLPAVDGKQLIKGGIVVLVALGIIGLVVIPSWRNAVVDGATGAVTQVRRLIAPSLEIVHPTTAQATSQLEEHSAGRLIDTFTNTDWRTSEGTPSITLTFQEPIDLGAIYVHNGAAAEFLDLRRPSRIELHFADGSVKELDLVDDHEPHPFTVEANGIDQVEIRVIESNGPAGAPLAISEIEFFRSR
jgi:hypothetical protein